MSAHEWKPGDVAMVLCSDGNERPAMFYDYEGVRGRWTFPSGSYRWEAQSDVRPLVVIDPESREQVERLARLFQSAFDDIPYENDDLAAEMTDAGQAALREFANPTPPKPPEPTGLGAVVEDSKGVAWVKAAGQECGWVKADSKSRRDSFCYLNWHLIDAVKVLGEGVQP